MLVVEGLLPLAWLLVWIWGIFDYPRQAPWLSKPEKEYLDSTFQKELVEREPVSKEVFWRSIFAPQVLLLALIKLLMLSGQLGYLFWLPSALGSYKNLSNFMIGILYTFPFVVGALSLLYNSAHSDRFHERRAHVAVAMGIGGIALFAGVLTITRFPLISYLLVCVAAIGAFAGLGPFWAIPTEWFSRKMAGSIAGFVNGVGNIGGILGPLLVGYLNKRSGNFLYGFALLASFMVAGAILPLFLRPPAHQRTTTVSLAA